MSARQHYTRAQLIRFVMGDLIASYRQEIRGGETDYAGHTLALVKRLWTNRHAATLDAYGWPRINGEGL